MVKRLATAWRPMVAFVFGAAFAGSAAAAEETIFVPKGYTGSKYDGAITVENANYFWVDNADGLHKDLVIVYSNATAVAAGGKLKLGNTDVPIWANARVLAVGGGGGGGHYGSRSLNRGGGGGGGAGGMYEGDVGVFSTFSGSSAANDNTYAITIGMGGAGATANGQGTNGGDSYVTFSTVGGGSSRYAFVYGGGGGGGMGVGKDGGSGGGGSKPSAAGARVGGKPLVDGQGNAGGEGAGNYAGAGGGGAGGEGVASAADNPGEGGAGKESLITGRAVVYAGGGGGGELNSSSTSINGGLGGAGGGGTGAGISDATQGQDGFGGGGGGGGCSYVDGAKVTRYAGRGGSGVVIIRLSGFVVKAVPVPEMRTFTYDGVEHVGVDEFYAYTLSGPAKATDTGAYTVVCTIPASAPYNWDNADIYPELGRQRTIIWHINPLRVQKPDVLFTYAMDNPNGAQFDDKLHTAIDGPRWFLDGDGYCYVTNSLGMKLKFCQLTGHQETNAGDFTYTATLVQNAAGGYNFDWRKADGTTTTESLTTKWRLRQADNAISKLTLDDWQETVTTNNPACGWTWSEQAVRYRNLEPNAGEYDRVVYTYAKSDTRPESDAEYTLTELPTEAGVYWVRAYICKDSKHEPGNWVEAKAYKRFCIWRHPNLQLTDYVDITISGVTSTSLTDFPLLLRVSEAKTDTSGSVVGGIPGFTYDRAGTDGSELRFVQLALTTDYDKKDADRDAASRSKDKLLPFEVDTWRTAGESLVWVKVPTLGSSTKLRMYWHRRDPAKAPLKDKPSTETWNDNYIGVWHLGSRDSVTKAFPNSTANGTVLDATTGTVTFKNDAAVGNGVLVTGSNLMVDDPLAYLSGAFSFTGWYRGDEYTSGIQMFAGTKANGTAANIYESTPGWCFTMKNRTVLDAYYDGNTAHGTKDVAAIGGNWFFVSLRGNASGTSVEQYFGVNGVENARSAVVKPNGPLQLCAPGFAADEIRLSKVQRTAAWVQAEYNSSKNAKYAYSLVNRPLADDPEVRSWVNYWTKAPTLKRYWNVGEISRGAVTAGSGSLMVGPVTNIFWRMPDHTEVFLPGFESTKGPYLVDFEKFNPVDKYGQVYTYLDGTRELDIEIIDHDPRPIDPVNPGGGTATGRVLLGNDDTNAVDSVTGQSYWRTQTAGVTDWYWEHEGDMAPIAGLNIRNGSEHRFYHVAEGVTNRLWHLRNVYFGNLMTNDDSVTVASLVLSNRFNTLPWSTTGLGSSTFDAYTNAFARSEATYFILRNSCDFVADGEYSELTTFIESPCYTNGIGTVYFDVANAYAKTDVTLPDLAKYTKLVVEYSTQTNDEESAYYDTWTPVAVTNLEVRGSNVQTVKSSTNGVDFLNVRRGGQTSGLYFYRVAAPINVKTPVRFRIRRAAAWPDDGAGDPQPDDVRGWVLVDNVIASWPAPTPSIVPVGAYDETREGKQVLGWETAFSVPYPSVSDSFKALARITGGTTNNVASARLHYRWRYADMAFEPARTGTRDWWNTSYFNVTNETFESTDPIALNGQVGDIEYYYDLTAIAPYYSYVDYSGINKGLFDRYSEEPYPLAEAKSESKQVFPSHGTHWFVRLREWPSETRGYTLYTRTSTNDASAVTVTPMEFVSAHGWRGCVRTKEAPADGKLYFRIESEKPANPGAANLVFTTNRWTTAETEGGPLPTEMSLQETSSATAWSSVPCDAATGYLAFQIEQVKGSLTIAHADWQDFNLWSAGRSDDGLFRGSSVETNSVSRDTKDTDAMIGTWPVSVSTNARWTVDFGSSPGEPATTKYPRNKPFSSAVVNGWEAANGMWTCRKWTMTSAVDVGGKLQYLGYGDDSSVQLQGRGLGSLSFIGNTDSPDGLDTIVYSARLAQFNEFENFTYFNGITLGQLPGGAYDGTFKFATDMTEGTFVVGGALTVGGEASFAGDGSLSLVTAYHPSLGCYEFRVSRSYTARGTRLALYRWNLVNGSMVCTPLAQSDGTPFKDWGDKSGEAGDLPITHLVRDDAAQFAGLYISFKPAKGVTDKTKDATIIRAGVMTTDFSPVTSATSMSGKNFDTIMYVDTTEQRLTQGTYGVLARNCPGVFVRPFHYATGLGSPGGSVTDNKLVFYSNTKVDFPTGDVQTEGTKTDGYYKLWVVKPGRTERYSGSYCGFQAITDAARLNQKIYVQTKPINGSTWTSVATNTITGFGDREVTFRVRDARQFDVRLQVGGEAFDTRTDVVINNARLSQWNGKWTDGSKKDFEKSTATWGHQDDFVFTTGWVVGEEGDKAVRLQPCRAPDSGAGQGGTPVSVRSPLMRGFGLFHFKWRNADPRCRLFLQINRTVTRNYLMAQTEASADSTNWETIKTFDFGELASSGYRTVYLNERYPAQGALRLVIDPDVQGAAISGGNPSTDPLYGSVEITEAFCWDDPEYDQASWSGFNFRTSGWDGADPDNWANLTDGLRGLSGVLNNTLDEETLFDREKGHYRQRAPSIQSPTFGTNFIGQVEFRARLYGQDDLSSYGHGAVVTVFGTALVNPASGEPSEMGWKELGEVTVTNRFYAPYSLRLKSSDQIRAVRFAVKGVEGVQKTEHETAPLYTPPLRVALDDLCLTECSPASVAFRRLHVRPFRNADAIKGHAEVDDITSPEEQPLLGEAFGFQAEVEVKNTDEVIVGDPAYPISVDLWYYDGGEVWGYDLWRTNAATIHVALTPAEGKDLVFRSTVENSLSLCRPQTVRMGETHKLVQYMMTVTYYDRSHDAITRPMAAEEWTMPAWNEGFVNPNTTNGLFSAFTLLEEIAPKRAWINEVNLTEPTKNASQANQWFELAVPAGVDMTDWKVLLYDYKGALTASMVTLGRKGAPASKLYTGSNPDGLASHYAFYTVKSPYTSTLAADATWPSIGGNGVLDRTSSYGFELVRPSGVVEHRAVVQGWNQYKDAGYWYYGRYEGTNVVETLNGAVGPGWVWGEEDLHADADAGKTVGVIANQGGVHEDWASPLAPTPGDINEGQYIDPNWFTYPNGGYVWIYSSVLGENMRQTLGEQTGKTASLTVAQGTTTNIVFEVDKWYKLATCTVTGSEGRTNLTSRTEGGKTIYTLTLNMISNRIDVTAAADVSDEIANMGVVPDHPYKPAIMNWLKRGVTGGPDGGAHPFVGDKILPAHYRGTRISPYAPDRSDEIDLVGMYWLDIDPTDGNWELWGGMGEPFTGQALGQVDEPKVRERALEGGGLLVHTNHLTTVWLMLTNSASHVCYAPYRMQGLGNEQSDNFPGVWTSATFKVTMRLANGKVDDIFQPMRYFVFDTESFRKPDDPVAPFAARVEVTDPFSRQSPAWEWGWPKYSDCNVFTGWEISQRITPSGVSTLKKDDTFTY